MIDRLTQQLLPHLNGTVTEVLPVSGGDISVAYRINTTSDTYFLKTNHAASAYSMFETEAYGLKCIAQTQTIKTPKVIAYNRFEDLAFLLLEFIPSKSPSSEDFKVLGTQLAKLHQHSTDYFGLDQNNFIGRLQQYNSQHKSWVDFYTHERLQPQLELAKQKGLLQASEYPDRAHIKKTLTALFQNIKPSLLHGDLWSGNYIIATDGTPYLIDPAVYYGHHEVDIAMTKLFGGFSETFYNSYASIIKADSNTLQRIDIYQLYYLLVHLNMFGSSYYKPVSTILKRYF